MEDQEEIIHPENTHLLWSDVVDVIEELGDDILTTRPNLSRHGDENFDNREIIAINKCKLKKPIPVEILSSYRKDHGNQEIENVQKTLLDIYAIQTRKNVSIKDLEW